MPSIRIQHAHSLTPGKAKQAVSKIAERIAAEFSVQTRWEDNVLHFQRTGVDGTIALDGAQVNVNANLSFLLTPIRAKVESEIRRYLNEQLA